MLKHMHTRHSKLTTAARSLRPHSAMSACKWQVKNGSDHEAIDNQHLAGGPVDRLCVGEVLVAA